MASLLGRKVSAPFDPLHFVSEVVIFDGVAKPTRIIVTPQMEHPRRLVYAFRYLTENGEVLRPQVVPVVRSAKEETLVAHVAFGVFPKVTNTLRPSRLRPHRKGHLVVADEPRHDFARLALQTCGPCQALACRTSIGAERFLGRGSDRKHHVDRGEHGRCE